MRPAIVMVGVLFCALVSGCAAQSKSDSTTQVPTDIQNVEVTKETGAIRGVVVTPSITPITDATVKIVSLNLTKKTSSAGSFSFSNLKPGTYFIEASKIGYSKVQTSTVVTAGDDNPPVVKIQLVEDLANRPFSEVLSWKGFLQCAAGAVAVTVNPCAFSGSDNVHSFPYNSRMADYTQGEMVWSGTQPSGNYMSFGWNKGSLSDWQGTEGASPLILKTPLAKVQAAYGNVNVTGLTARVFAAYSNPLIVTIITNQDFRVFTTHFYGFQPRADWTFIKDGECVKPELCS
jgi:hypothetical protein